MAQQDNFTARVTVFLEGLTYITSDDFKIVQKEFDVGEFHIRPRTQKDSSWVDMINPVTFYVATTDLLLPKLDALPPPEVYERVDALITCLRLFKFGYIAPYPAIAKILSGTGQSTKQITQFAFGSTARNPSGGLAYALFEKEIERLETFCGIVYPLFSSGPYVSLKTPALRFYNRGVDDVTRGDHALAIVDFVSCMEALVSPGKQELRHRLSENVAMIVERDPLQRQLLYDQCLDLYDDRSIVIHGGRLDGQASQKGATTAQVFAQRTLLFCISFYLAGKGQAEILKDIEMTIFGKKDTITNSVPALMKMADITDSPMRD